MKIAVTGASGQMGSNIIKSAQNEGIDIAFAVDREKCESRGVKVENDEKFLSLLREKEVDVIVDFTAPEATMNYVIAAKETNTPIVIGTTGFSSEQEDLIIEASNQVPIIKDSNFAPGVNVMKKLVRKAAENLKDYDIEVTETHHNRKNDAPSGTAKTLVNEIKKSRELEEVHGRRGKASRSEKEIGVHARRAGDVKGTHEVLLAGNQEVLKVSHRSESRQVFASGSLEAAIWLEDKENGFYTFAEVLK